jgi:phosphoglycerate-specific signal transduction histidine kinase
MTERKRVQSLLERTRAELDSAIRSATIGELSASIAHDVAAADRDPDLHGCRPALA